MLLLEHIISMWDVNDQVFHVGPHVLKMELEDIYFLIGLSKKGETISFSGHRGRPRIMMMSTNERGLKR